MTIHHDKLAYGRLKKLNEEMTDKQIEDMLKELAEAEKDGKTNEKEEKDG